jgi:integrase
VKVKDLKALPCTFAMMPEPQGRMIVLSEEQADVLMKGAIGDQDPDTWLFVAFGLNTAMRHREILRARFDEIDWARGRLHIGKAKAGGREQPLTPALVEILRKERKQRADRDGYIFKLRGPDKSGRGYRNTMRPQGARHGHPPHARFGLAHRCGHEGARPNDSGTGRSGSERGRNTAYTGITHGSRWSGAAKRPQTLEG